MLRHLPRPLLKNGRGLASVVGGPSLVPACPIEKGSYINYAELSNNISLMRKRAGRPLTLAEKILYSHVAHPHDQELIRGRSQLVLNPKRVALHDANAQLALLQFMTTGRSTVSVPTSVHTDHLVTARQGADVDLARAIEENKEVYDFLESCSAKYGIAYWKPGAGILHQVIFEQYAYPGGLMIASDSHTPNAAGLGMLGIGVGGMEAVDVMAGLPYTVKHPNIIGVRLTGQLSPWATTKDIILKVASVLTVKGGTGCIIEYFGPGTDTLTATGMATIGNMGAEVGATSSIFPLNTGMGDYLRLTDRHAIASAASAHAANLCADEGAEYDTVIDIDLSLLEPHVNGPYTPDLSFPISQLAENVEAAGWPNDISAALIGSCTNSSYEDLSRAASIARQATEAGLKPTCEFLLAPGSEEVRATVERDGVLADFAQAGTTVLANACGACVGQWERPGISKGDRNTILSSFNRNFSGRQDGNPATHSFVASPELVTAMAFAGSMSFNPLKDTLTRPDGSVFAFSPPEGHPLPPKGYARTLEFYSPPRVSETAEIVVDPKSTRIQLLTPFAPWDGQDAVDLELLIKVRGKCTTDHISAAGPWYKYRGHLENISNNLLIGAINDENGKANSVRSALTGDFGPVPETAAAYRDAGARWAVVAGDNYGEGSSREAAALSPRYMGAYAIIARSMARIHETNLKKQGVLPLFFKDPAVYDNIKPGAKLRLDGVADLAPDSNIRLTYTNSSGTAATVDLKHSLTAEQVEWFRAGSALNTLRPK